MTLEDNLERYYAALSSGYDETAGYNSPEAEELRIPIKKRFREIFRGRNVLEIACGTGYWTEVIAGSAKSVLATDINPSVISKASERCRDLKNVGFRVADAYTLDGVPSGFDAAFAHWWWSHVPRAKLGTFLEVLHGRLDPGSLVLFRDHLAFDWFEPAGEIDGNHMETRKLPGGGTVDIVKNYPSKAEITGILEDIADDIRYIEYPDENSWDVIYRTR